jgi:hypothetical protein
MLCSAHRRGCSRGSGTILGGGFVFEKSEKWPRECADRPISASKPIFWQEGGGQKIVRGVIRSLSPSSPARCSFHFLRLGPITPSGPSKWPTDQAGFAKKGLTGVFLSQASVMPGLCSCQGWIHFTRSAPSLPPWLVGRQRICVGKLKRLSVNCLSTPDLAHHLSPAPVCIREALNPCKLKAS